MRPGQASSHLRLGVTRRPSLPAGHPQLNPNPLGSSSTPSAPRDTPAALWRTGDPQGGCMSLPELNCAGTPQGLPGGSGVQRAVARTRPPGTQVLLGFSSLPLPPDSSGFEGGYSQGHGRALARPCPRVARRRSRGRAGTVRPGRGAPLSRTDLGMQQGVSVSPKDPDRIQRHTGVRETTCEGPSDGTLWTDLSLPMEGGTCTQNYSSISPNSSPGWGAQRAELWA